MQCLCEGQKCVVKTSSLLKKSAFLLLFLCINAIAFGQDTTQTKKIKILPFPAFGYEPETETHVGAVALFVLNLYQDTLTRSSNAKVEFNYTWRKQSIFEIEWDYFFRNEQFFSDGLLHFSLYPDFYFGIGNNTSSENELLFESKRTQLNAGIYKNIGKKRFVGLGIKYSNYHDLDFGEAQNPFSELKSTEVWGIKTAFFKDERNNLLNATKGSFAALETIYNLSNQENYFQLNLDVRKYWTSRKQLTLALRLYNAFIFNTPAFFDYAIMGGDQFVRGYFHGRFRDKNLSTLQLELRKPLIGRFGGAIFGGVSTLHPEADAFAQRIMPNYGAGIRFLIDKESNTNLRFDFALGLEEESGFYISFGESF